LVALELERAAKQQEIAGRIAAIDDNIALARIDRRRKQASEFSQVQADADEQAIRMAQLARQFDEELSGRSAWLLPGST
jgi:hypothetical protein